MLHSDYFTLIFGTVHRNSSSHSGGLAKVEMFTIQEEGLWQAFTTNSHLDYAASKLRLMFWENVIFHYLKKNITMDPGSHRAVSMSHKFKDIQYALSHCPSGLEQLPCIDWCSRISLLFWNDRLW